MAERHPQIINLLKCIDYEDKEQIKRYSLDQQHTLKSLKADGLALHPIQVIRKNFGYADYPEISFKLNFPSETNLFKDGSAIECFYTGEEPIKGVLLSLDGKIGEFRLFAPDFPDWIEENGVGIKLAPDQRTTSIMKNALVKLESNKILYKLFEKIHSSNEIEISNSLLKNTEFNWENKNLNESQKNAVNAILQNDNITIVHGPPGTGKTTTLIEAIIQLININEKILVSAPSNTAVDNIAKGLITKGVKLLRVGNISKVDELIFKHTPEGKLLDPKLQKEIKQLKFRAEEFRKMALKYKRSFGKAEREQRNLLFKEVKNIRLEIKKLQNYNEEKLYNEAKVILGTPVGLYDTNFKNIEFNTLIIDEAGQMLEPLAWCIFPMANKIVLAGDHLQLPPTVLSNEAMKLGFNKSILEIGINKSNQIYLLNTQYRMQESIAGFSSNYFYNGLLKTANYLISNEKNIYFIDTAGSGNQEEKGTNGSSLQNNGELELVNKIIETENLNSLQTAFISPYAGQVAAAKDVLPKEIKVCTIDSFQGQEKENIILSLVRSNDNCEIGFLKDYRRMNVAITRAKQKLFVIGDSATIAADHFYNEFITYVEKFGIYKTIWQYEN